MSKNLSLVGQNAKCRIAPRHIDKARSVVAKMNRKRKEALVDEVYAAQPNMLASVLVQPRFGVSMEKVDWLLRVMLICFQVMKETKLEWALITEDDQEKYLQREAATEQFADGATEEQLAIIRDTYVNEHPEPALLAYVTGEITVWLLELAETNQEAESDKYVMMAALNFAHCIGHAKSKPVRRPSKRK